MNRDQNHEKVKKLVGLALLAAIVAVLQLVGSGIRIGAVPISLVLVPIVIGAILYGPAAGGILGGVFGLITLIAGIMGTDPFTFTLWSASPIWTALLCLGKAILCGVAAGYVYQAFQKKNFVACLIASMAAPIVNTGIFALGMLTVLRESLIAIAGGTSVVYFLLIVMIGVNFLVEFAVNVILSTVVTRVVQAVGHKK